MVQSPKQRKIDVMPENAIRAEGFEMDKNLEEAKLTTAASNDLSPALTPKETNKTDYNSDKENQSQFPCLQDSNDDFEESGNDTRISEFTYETLTKDMFIVASFIYNEYTKKNTKEFVARIIDLKKQSIDISCLRIIQRKPQYFCIPFC